MTGFTAVQLETLRFIAAFVAERGYPPSFIDMGQAWGIQKSAVFDRLAALEKKGLIRRTPKLARSIRLTPLGIETLRSGTTIDRTSTTDCGQRPSPMASRSEGENT